MSKAALFPGQLHGDFFLKSPVARLIVAVETNGRFVYADVNAAAAQYFEITRTAPVE